MKIILTETQYNRLVETQELDEGLLNTIGDIVGIADPTGIVDIINSISYWRQDKKTFALLSLLSAIPGADFVTKPFILGGKIIGGISQTKILGWLVRTVDKWVGLVLNKIDKMLLSKIPFIKNFASAIRTFILSLKKDSQMKLSESKIKSLLIENNFDRIYNELYDKMLKSVCLKYTNGDYEKAQDFCQTGFIKAYQKFDQFRGDNVAGWVSMVIRNHILDELRKEKNKKQVTDFDFSRYDTKDEEYNDLFMGKYSEKDIKDAVDTLSPMYKKVLELYYFDDLTHDEIAKKLGVSTGTSKSNLFKAKANLKNYLERNFK